MTDVYKISIQEYLESKGIKFRQAGKWRAYCSSPFATDSNWSFCVYIDTNSFFDWSTGRGGNIVTLVSLLEGVSTKDAYNLLKDNKFNFTSVLDIKPQISNERKEKFNYTKYINTDREEIQQITEYANNRGIVHGYIPGFYYTFNETEEDWVRNPAMMFLHVDKNLNPCGVKFRKIKNEEPRFSARGKLGLYVLDYQNSSSLSAVCLYVMESETSANSMHEWLKSQKKGGVVISSGGVSTAPKEIPTKYKDLPRKVIIDYDGNEKLYQERLKLYEHLNATPIKLILPKGEDINSLFNQNKMYLIEHILKN